MVGGVLQGMEPVLAVLLPPLLALRPLCLLARILPVWGSSQDVPAGCGLAPLPLLMMMPGAAVSPYKVLSQPGCAVPRVRWEGTFPEALYTRQGSNSSPGRASSPASCSTTRPRTRVPHLGLQGVPRPHPAGH